MEEVFNNKVLCEMRKPREGEFYYEWIDNKTELMILKLDGQFIIVNSICPHMGARLELDKKNKKIKCPWHGLEAGLSIHQDGTNRVKCNHHKYRFINLYKFHEAEDRLIILSH